MLSVKMLTKNIFMKKERREWNRKKIQERRLNYEFVCILFVNLI